jgi:hypothetical protein
MPDSQTRYPVTHQIEYVIQKNLPYNFLQRRSEGNIFTFAISDYEIMELRRVINETYDAPRKVIQFSATQYGVIALADDGTLWELDYKIGKENEWTKVINLPQP